MSYPEAPFLSRTELPIQNTHTTGRSGGPGRRAGGRTTLQTSSNRSDLKPLARTLVTNVVNLRPKTAIFSEKAVGLTTFVTTRNRKARKRSADGSRAGRRPPAHTAARPSEQARQQPRPTAPGTPAAPQAPATRTPGYAKGAGTEVPAPCRLTQPLPRRGLRPDDRQSLRRRRIHRNMPPTTAAPRPAPPIRPSKPVRARPRFGLVAGTSGAT